MDRTVCVALTVGLGPSLGESIHRLSPGYMSRPLSPLSGRVRLGVRVAEQDADGPPT